MDAYRRRAHIHHHPPLARRIIPEYEYAQYSDLDSRDVEIIGNELALRTYRAHNTERHHHRHHHHHHRSASLFPTGDLVTKPINLNGTNYPFRKSFLDESPKFAEKLVKFVQGAGVREVLPKETLVHLCNFVNWDSYGSGRGGGDMGVDVEVALFLLGRAVECKSLGEVVLGRLGRSVGDESERRRRRMGIREMGMKGLVQMVANVCLSGHSTDELKSWLKRWCGGLARYLGWMLESVEWDEAVVDRPELEREFFIVLGMERRREHSVVIL